MTARMSSHAVRAVFIQMLFVLGVLRLVMAVIAGMDVTHGDFFATLPGVYAERLNPTLWDAPDLANHTSFHRHGYGYGPAQYLTLFPIVFLDSYRQIAAVLLPVYVAAIVGLGYILWRLCENVAVNPHDRPARQIMAVYGVVFLFGPLLVALIQREFEVVQALAMVLAAYLVVRNRHVMAAVVLGYISLFKYWPAVMLGYFVLKRQWRAAAAFVATVGLVSLVAHATFDLSYFPFFSPGGIEGQWDRIYEPLTGDAPFCTGPTGTLANLHMGLCAILGGRDRLAELTYYGVIGTVAVMFLVMFVLLERAASQEESFSAGLRRVIEFSMIMMAGAFAVHGHYYYLSVLILPLTVVLYRALARSGWGMAISLALATLSYTMLSGFVIPVSILSRVTRRDVWSFYLGNGIYVYGGLILLGLLLWEYAVLVREARAARLSRGAVAVGS